MKRKQTLLSMICGVKISYDIVTPGRVKIVFDSVKIKAVLLPKKTLI